MLSKTAEVLLTVLALSQESYKGPMSHAIPSRLMSTLRKLRAKEFVEFDDDGLYLSEEGANELNTQGFGTRPL